MRTHLIQTIKQMHELHFIGLCRPHLQGFDSRQNTLHIIISLEQLRLLWLGLFWQAHRDGKSLTLSALLRAFQYRYCIDPEIVLQELMDQGLVVQTERRQYVLGRQLEGLTLADLYRQLPWKLRFDQSVKAGHPWQQQLQSYLTAGRESLLAQLDVPVVQCYQAD